MFWCMHVEGVRYMVVDCGGGTVDITVHEMDAKTGRLIELHKATGGPHGSTGMTRNEQLLCMYCNGERKCADIIGTVLVPGAGHFQC